VRPQSTTPGLTRTSGARPPADRIDHRDNGAQIAQLCIQHSQRRFGAVAEQIGGSSTRPIVWYEQADQHPIRVTGSGTERQDEGVENAGTFASANRRVRGI
jgi:hypothetical protein